MKLGFLTASTMILALSSCASSRAADTNTTPDEVQRVRVGEMVEFPFITEETIDHPFLEPISAAIQIPIGGEIAVPAFFDGSNAWKVRYTPLHAGTYRVKRLVRGEDIESTNTVATIEDPRHTAEVSDAPFRGFVQPSSEWTQQFVFDNGDPYFPIGHNAGWSSVDEYRAMFRKMHDAGLNWSRVWMPHWSGQNLEWVMGKTMAPGELDLDAARRMDDIIAAAQANDIEIQLVLQHHGQISTFLNPTWDRHPWNVANGGWLETSSQFFTDPKAKELCKRKYRYIVARWGYSPTIMAWELFNEVQYTDGYQGAETIRLWRQAKNTDFLNFSDLRKLAAELSNVSIQNQSIDRPSEFERLMDAWNRSRSGRSPVLDYGLGRRVVAEWHAEMAQYLRSIDPHPRMITTSCPPPDAPLWNEMDYYQIHTYNRDMIKSLASLPCGLDAYDKPVFIAEMGDHDIADPAKADGRYMHGMMWAGLFSGAAGAAQVWAWDSVEARNLYPQFRAMAQFARDAQLGTRHYVPAPPLAYRAADRSETPSTSSYVLSTDRTVTFWLYNKITVNEPNPAEQEGFVELPLPIRNDVTLHVTWWNTRSGTSTRATVTSLVDGAWLRTPPFAGDLAAILEIGMDQTPEKDRENEN